MIAAWLALALAEPLSAADHQRLLGPEPGSPAAAAPAPTPELPWWPVPIALAAAGAWAWLKQRGGRLTLTGDSEMRVVSKSPLGQQHGLCLIEVRDAEGGWRRLLVAHGPQGPQLLTGLGRRGDFAPALDAASVDDLPEAIAFAVDAPRARIHGLDPAPRVELRSEPPPIRDEPPPVRVEPARVRHDPPPVRREAPPEEPPARVPRGYAEVAASAPPREPARTVQDGLALLAEVRRAKTSKGVTAWA
jgi:hypothetical protein